MVGLDPASSSGDLMTISTWDGEIIRTFTTGAPIGRKMEIPRKITPKVLIAFIDESDPDGPITWTETLPVRNIEISHGMDDFPTMTIEVALI